MAQLHPWKAHRPQLLRRRKPLTFDTSKNHQGVERSGFVWNFMRSVQVYLEENSRTNCSSGMSKNKGVERTDFWDKKLCDQWENPARANCSLHFSFPYKLKPHDDGGVKVRCSKLIRKFNSRTLPSERFKVCGNPRTCTCTVEGILYFLYWDWKRVFSGDH